MVRSCDITRSSSITVINRKTIARVTKNRKFRSVIRGVRASVKSKG